MTSWWSSDRISATVTESYISKKFPPKKQEALRGPLGFGIGLTDATYIDWILEKSPRFFLILDDIGCAEHIFESVDQSFADDDLPLSSQGIADLKLTGGQAKKFAKRQFAFLVKELVEGAHVDYGDEDVIPVNSLPRNKSIPLGINVDKVQVGDKTFLRRCLSLNEESGIERIHFVLHFKALQKLRHPHLTSVWATYTYQENGYILLQPSSDLTLKSFFEEPPKHFRQLSKPEQRDISIRWIQCLASALSFLHENGHAHQAIRPSNIYIDNQYSVFLGAYGALGALEDRDAAFEKDAYNHGSPEQWQKRAAFADTNPLRSTLQSGGRTGRRIKPPRSSTLHPDSNAVALPSSPDRSRAPSRSSELPDLSGHKTLSRRLSTLSSTNTESTSSSHSSSETRTRTRRTKRAVISTLTYSQPSASKTIFDSTPYYPSDVFALSTVITSLLSLLASSKSSKLAPSNIPAHLSKRNRTAGRGGAPADTSWHANLLQVSAWLEALDASASEKKESRLPTLGRKDKSAKDSDSEAWRYGGFLTTMTNLMRYGFQKDVKVRWTSPDGVQKISDALRRWGIEPAKCCEGKHGRMLHTPTPDNTSSTSKKSRESVLRQTPPHPEAPRRDELKKANRKHTIRSPTRKPPPSDMIIPEEIPSPGLPELEGEDMDDPRVFRLPLQKLRHHDEDMPELPASEADMYSPRRPDFSPLPPVKGMGPPLALDYPAPLERVVSPLTPADQHWEFDFGGSGASRLVSRDRTDGEATETSTLVGTEGRWTALDRRYAGTETESEDDEESVGDEIEDLIQAGFDAGWSSPQSPYSPHSPLSPPPPLAEKYYSNRKLPPPPLVVPGAREVGRQGPGSSGSSRGSRHRKNTFT